MGDETLRFLIREIARERSRELQNDDFQLIEIGTELEPSISEFWYLLFCQAFLSVKRHDDRNGEAGGDPSDDLLFFVAESDQPMLKVFRRNSPSIPRTLDASVNWEETVYVNLLMQYYVYVLTIAVCKRTGLNESQILRKCSKTIYASTNRHSMESKGAVEQCIYPNLFFAIDNYDELFDDFTLHDNECLCIELTAYDRCGHLQGSCFVGSSPYSTLRKSYDVKIANTKPKTVNRNYLMGRRFGSLLDNMSPSSLASHQQVLGERCFLRFHDPSHSALIELTVGLVNRPRYNLIDSSPLLATGPSRRSSRQDEDCDRSVLSRWDRRHHRSRLYDIEQSGFDMINSSADPITNQPLVLNAHFDAGRSFVSPANIPSVEQLVFIPDEPINPNRVNKVNSSSSSLKRPRSSTNLMSTLFFKSGASAKSPPMTSARRPSNVPDTSTPSLISSIMLQYAPSTPQQTRAFSSREGRLHQVEYAMEAVSHAGTCLGITATNGIVLSAERKFINNLLDETAFSEKIYRINDDIACSVAGITSDANILIDEMRLIAQRYLLTYQEPIPLEQFVSHICDIQHSYTMYGGKRPFGVSMLFIGWDKRYGYQLFQTDPSGNYLRWKAACIGSNNAAATSALEQDYDPDCTLDSAIKLCVKTLTKTMTMSKLTSDKVEIGVLERKDNKTYVRLLNQSELETLIKAADAEAALQTK